jgi:LmbE family N-acetylglucosaminyl deacetylase
MSRLLALLGLVVRGVGRRSTAAAMRARHLLDVVVGTGVARLGRRATPPAPAVTCTGGSLTVVAHPDDDLFFTSPDLLEDVAARRCVSTVYLTSGDAGLGTAYARARERGVAAAYAATAAVPDVWSVARVSVAGRLVTEATLVAAPTTRLYFVRLPDGQMDGRGTARSGRRSLQALLEGRIRTLWTVETPAQPHDRSTVVQLVQELLTRHAPTVVRTLDPGSPATDDGHGDHSDHRAVARLTVQARAAARPEATLVEYLGYPSSRWPENVSEVGLAAKEAALAAYALHDRLMCQSAEDCRSRPEGSWLRRQYRVATVAGPVLHP